MERWNRRLPKILWLVVLAGVLGSLPLIAARVETERSAKTVTIALDYRDLLQVAAAQADPQSFVEEWLPRLKTAGVNAMIVFESTLEELAWSGAIAVYDAKSAALLQGRVEDPSDNGTYVLFRKPEEEAVLRPIIESAFGRLGVAVTPWRFGEWNGLRIHMGYSDAMLRPMQPNPLAMRKLHEAGFLIVPRLSDRVTFDAAELERWLDAFGEFGVNRIVFDGNAVTGYADHAAKRSLDKFAALLNERGIGVGIFENLKVPQQGMYGLTQRLHYNAVRAHPVSEAESVTLKPEQLADRIVLAVKDRNIRMIYLNTTYVRDGVSGKVKHSLGTIEEALAGDADRPGAVERLKGYGFTPGDATAFTEHGAPLEPLWRALVIAGAVALTALACGLFAPNLLVPVTAIGAAGGAAAFALDKELPMQGLALLAAISSPTVAVIWLVRRLRERREPAGADAAVASGERSVTGDGIARNGGRSRVAGKTAGRRLGEALLLYAAVSLLSLVSVPIIMGLLDDIRYSLVLQQFRGVSLLHLAPVALVAIYVFLYGPGGSVWDNARRILAMPLTVLWLVAGAVLGLAGMYYLSRTGNSGLASSLELQFRWMLENTFGVRPRTKEFLFGHPLLLIGIFLSLRYRWALGLLILATIGQLSMVDTFAHIHTPAVLSLIRVLLGLGLGLLAGLAGVAVWQAAEWLWRRGRLFRERA
mgnify:CR=1 FL=1